MATISISSYKIIIPETRHIVFVNALPDEHVNHQLVINLTPTQESMIQNSEDIESVLFDDDDGDNTYTTVWIELLTNHEEVGTLRFLDGSQVLDHETCTMIRRSILMDLESIRADDDFSGTKIIPEHSSVKINHGNGKDEEEEECDICVICQEELQTGDIIYILDCGHLYHEECIEKWLLEDNICPVCRNTVFSFLSMN